MVLACVSTPKPHDIWVLGNTVYAPNVNAATFRMVWVVSRAGGTGFAAADEEETGNLLVRNNAIHVGGIPEVVEDGRNALLVPPEAPEALAEAIERVLSDVERKTLLATEGRATAVAAYSLDVAVTAYTAIYDSLKR